MSVEIDVFRSEHAGRFAELNRQWLEEYHLMESAEEEQLADPQKHFLNCGGQIFVALHNGHVVGTCAVIPPIVWKNLNLRSSQSHRSFGAKALHAVW
jgi:hypothetical protein